MAKTPVCSVAPARPVAWKVTGLPPSVPDVAVSVFAPAVVPSVHEPAVARPDAFVVWYRGSVEKLFVHPRPALIGYAAIVGIMAFLFLRLPTSFLPEEDQGVVIAQAILPPGAVLSRTLAVLKGVLGPVVDEPVSFVNAPQIAEQRGWRFYQPAVGKLTSSTA